MSGNEWARRARHPLLRAAGALLLATVAVVVMAAPAWAHATLQSTNPLDGARLAAAPTQVSLTFDENVEISFGSIQLFDQKGNRVDTPAPHHAATGDHTVQVSLPKLGDGAYVVSWRVISADSHPVHGAFTFTVGRSSVNPQSLATTIEAKSAGSGTVGVLFGIARAAEFVGIALLLGGVTFSAAIRPRERERSRADATAWIGWGVLLVATIAGFLLQGPYAGGLPLTQALDGTVVRAVAHTHDGKFALIRLALVLGTLPLLLLVRRRARPPLWWWAIALPVGVAIAATPGLAGHAATGTFTQLAIPLDTLHVVAMAVWLGGLVALALAIFSGDTDAGRASERFSPVALSCVALIAGSGVFAAWRQVGWSMDALRDTTYGRLLLTKLGAFAVLLALAAVSRLVLRRRRPSTLSAAVATETASGAGPAPTGTSGRRLLWSVGGEVVFGITVLVITALLVNAQPARSALTLPFSKEIREPTMLVDIIVAPAKANVPVALHIYALSPAGGSLYSPGITAQISQPSKGVAPIEVPLVRGGPNHFLTRSLVVPFPGKWLLVVRALRTEVDEVAVQTPVRFR